MTSFLSSILKSRLSVCLSTFCPQVVKIITFVHSNPATSHGGQWSVQWVAGGGGLGISQDRGNVVVGGLVRGLFSVVLS